MCMPNLLCPAWTSCLHKMKSGVSERDFCTEHELRFNNFHSHQIFEKKGVETFYNRACGHF